MSERIERELSVPAAADEVWDAVTGDGWLAEEVRFDLRPGGDASFRSDGSVKAGWVEEAVAPGADSGRLIFWWAADGEPASRVELTIWEGESGTRLRVIETRPLELLDLIGMPLPGLGGSRYGPALVAA
jgi:uncharacterized protein YndB with AHSA1/START domain